jgi:hypothetical protein
MHLVRLEMGDHGYSQGIAVASPHSVKQLIDVSIAESVSDKEQARHLRQSLAEPAVVRRKRFD